VAHFAAQAPRAVAVGETFHLDGEVQAVGSAGTIAGAVEQVRAEARTRSYDGCPGLA